MDGFTFIGLNEAFWFGGLPFLVYLFWAEYNDHEKGRKHIDELTSLLLLKSSSFFLLFISYHSPTLCQACTIVNPRLKYRLVHY